MPLSTVSDPKDTKGFFGFANLGEDTYTITVTKIDYKGVIRKVILGEKELKKIKITMQKK